MKLAKNFGIAAAVAISVTAVGINPTQAALIDYNFTVDATSGDNPGKYFGSFRYDDSTLTGVGDETVGVGNELTVLFDYLGTKYTEVSDFNYVDGSFPVVSFQDGKLLGLSYLVEDQFFIGGAPEASDIGGSNFYSILSADLLNTTKVGTVNYAKVPEPMTVGGTAIATVMGLWLKRKKKATKVAD